MMMSRHQALRLRRMIAIGAVAITAVVVAAAALSSASSDVSL
jgi:hypothetical protein